MSEEKLKFQAEVSRLLDIVANSLYADKEIFLRELISNASDACDRLRYAALTQPELVTEDPDFRIRLNSDSKARKLTISDNGIGMNRDDLVENLGTIARSGTAAFIQDLVAPGPDDKVLEIGTGCGYQTAILAELAATVYSIEIVAGPDLHLMVAEPL